MPNNYLESGARVQEVLNKVTTCLNIRPLKWGGTSSTLVADYHVVTDAVYIKPEIVDSLTDFELGCILAHEAGHANTRAYFMTLRLAALLVGLITFLAILVIGLNLSPTLWMAPFVAFLGWKSAKYMCLRVDLLAEFMADDYAVKFSKDAGAYKTVLIKLIALVKVPTSTGVSLRLRRLDKIAINNNF